MGRLQKKKDSSNKKKKKQDEVSSQKDNDIAVKKVSLPASGSSQKSFPAVQKKPSEQGRIQKAISDSVQFLREVRAELKKVTWPSRKQTMGSTVVVIIIVMIISLFLGMVDMGLSSLIHYVLQ